MNMYVQCSCGNDHSSTSVVTINIEEDIFGRDLVTFVCPITKNETKSLVFIDPIGDHISRASNEQYWTE